MNRLIFNVLHLDRRVHLQKCDDLENSKKA
jgi:hypothetical protein